MAIGIRHHFHQRCIPTGLGQQRDVLWDLGTTAETGQGTLMGLFVMWPPRAQAPCWACLPRGGVGASPNLFLAVTGPQRPLTCTRTRTQGWTEQDRWALTRKEVGSGGQGRLGQAGQEEAMAQVRAARGPVLPEGLRDEWGQPGALGGLAQARPARRSLSWWTRKNQMLP